MNPNLQTAIIEFIANEFHLQSDSLGADTNFKLDLNLQGQEITELLQRLQDALNFSIPEEKEGDIDTIGDILNALALDPDASALDDRLL